MSGLDKIDEILEAAQISTQEGLDGFSHFRESVRGVRTIVNGRDLLERVEGAAAWMLGSVRAVRAGHKAVRVIQEPFKKS